MLIHLPLAFEKVAGRIAEEKELTRTIKEKVLDISGVKKLLAKFE
jgi:hypothetical protein